MRATRFEELGIWQKARDLTKLVYSITNHKTFTDFSLKDQIRRAAVSIMSNIAEGFERGGKEEFIHFLYIAKASCGEVRAQNYIVFDQNYITEKVFLKLKEKTQILSASIYKFIESLKRSGYKGLKFKQNKNSEIDDFLAPYLNNKK